MVGPDSLHIEGSETPPGMLIVPKEEPLLPILKDILAEIKGAYAPDDYEIEVVKVVAQAPGVSENAEFGWQEEQVLGRMYATGWRLVSEWLYQACTHTGEFPTGYFHVFKFHRKSSFLKDPDRWLGVPGVALYLRKPKTYVVRTIERIDDIKLPSTERTNPETNQLEPYVRLEDLSVWVDTQQPRLDTQGKKIVGS